MPILAVHKTPLAILSNWLLSSAFYYGTWKGTWDMVPLPFSSALCCRGSDQWQRHTYYKAGTSTLAMPKAREWRHCRCRRGGEWYPFPSPADYGIWGSVVSSPSASNFCTVYLLFNENFSQTWYSKTLFCHISLKTGTSICHLSVPMVLLTARI